MARYEKGRRLTALGGGRAVPAIGSQRRIWALMCLGWTCGDIANAAGWSHRNRVLRIVNGQKGKPTTWLERRTAEAISRAYETLSMTTPELTAGRSRIKIHAARHGYAPPLAWDDIDNPEERPRRGGYDREMDDVVVDRLLAGERIKSNPAEKHEAMRRWIAQGRSQKSLAEMHGWKEGRYVDREEGAA